MNTQSFFDLHAMHFRAVDECIQEGRPFSFAAGTDNTGQPSPCSTHFHKPQTEAPTMAVVSDMQTEATAMLEDSRDYHELDGKFLLVRDGDSVWLCRQTDSVSLDDQERLMCVATQSVPVFTVPDCPECACVQDGRCLCTPSKPHAYAAELDSLHLELRDVHDGEADDDTDFDVWMHDMAANNEGLFQKAAQRFIELEKLLDVQ